MSQNRSQRRRGVKAQRKTSGAQPPAQAQGGIQVQIGDLLQKIGGLTVEVDFYKARAQAFQQEVERLLEARSLEAEGKGEEATTPIDAVEESVPSPEELVEVQEELDELQAELEGGQPSEES